MSYIRTKLKHLVIFTIVGLIVGYSVLYSKTVSVTTVYVLLKTEHYSASSPGASAVKVPFVYNLSYREDVNTPHNPRDSTDLQNELEDTEPGLGPLPADNKQLLVNSSHWNARLNEVDENYEKFSMLTLPYPRVSFKPENLTHREWFLSLLRYLKYHAVRSRPIAMVSSNDIFIPVLLNWLIAARLKVSAGGPVDNILIVAFDRETYALTTSHGFDSVLVPVDDVVFKDKGFFPKLLITRITIIRIINYLGFDVVHYDNDATVLKNPLHLLEHYGDSDIVGSTGFWPIHFGMQWGFTISMGFILFRNTAQTEVFWKLLSKSKDHHADDQWKFNHVLDASMNIVWDGDSTKTHPVTGLGVGGFKVTALSQRQVCRRKQNCHERFISDYYVWHCGGNKSVSDKIETASMISSWYVREDWETIARSSPAQGDNWLAQLTTS